LFSCFDLADVAATARADCERRAEDLTREKTANHGARGGEIDGGRRRSPPARSPDVL
jgi:hypothetical protein